MGLHKSLCQAINDKTKDNHHTAKKQAIENSVSQNIRATTPVYLKHNRQ